MAYTKTTWTDEVLVGAERFNIKDNVGTAIYDNVQILLATGVTTTGTSVDAVKMNNIENGIYALSRGAGASVKGVALSGADGDIADIVAASDGQVLRRASGSVGFGQVANAGIADSAIDSAKLAANAVIAGKIATGGVSASGQIADGIVTNAKLADHKEVIYLKVFWPDELLVVGNGAAFITIPAYCAGAIVDFDISVSVPSTSLLPTVQAANCGADPSAIGTDILSTRATVDVGEWSSMTALTQPVIANPNVASGDVIRIDVDVTGTGTMGLDIMFVIEKSG